MADPRKLPNFDTIKRVHIIGVCGTLMGAFAAYLKRRGIEVSGSDQNVYPPMSDVLSEAGVHLYLGYKPENILEMKFRPDLVVIGNVIPRVNPEARAAIDGGYAYTSLPEAMEQLLLPLTRNLVVSGTHGKTTTSSMLAHVLVACGKDPSYFIGGVSKDLPFSFHVSDLARGKLFVLEGDEYDTAFWDKVPKFNHYLPDHAVLTSVEYDHADIYPDFASVIRAFEGLVSRIRPGGHLIACFDFPVIQELAAKAKVPVISYGTDPRSGARFTPGRFRMDGELTRFDVLDQGIARDEISLRIPGRHNVLNALAVWIECRELGLPRQDVVAGLASFQGVKRRQEVRGEVGGVTVIDDFAHHPTAVRETLRALRLKYSGRRLIAVFEPRSATSRRKIFQSEYGQAFQEADQIFISNPYDQSKIPADEQFSSEQLVEDLRRTGKTAILMDTVESGVLKCAAVCHAGDIVAVLSNGGFGGFIPKLLETLQASRDV
ncbi:MAG TPA: UDP-N-acetylmuramate--L-alanine ligase [Bdellovibrionota bacterium]|nr:UDP-N-acetylmuramate--L-alanine ligase [Bdellovibrionota bacterium]